MLFRSGAELELSKALGAALEITVSEEGSEEIAGEAAGALSQRAKVNTKSIVERAAAKIRFINLSSFRYQLPCSCYKVAVPCGIACAYI